VASTKDRQRALERARYERVQAKIAKQQLAAKRRQRIAILTTTVVVLVGGGVAAAALAFSSDNSSRAIAANASSSANASAAPSASASAAANGRGSIVKSASKDVGVPTYDATAAAKPYTATIHTNHGDIVFTALTTKAPYTTFSFEYLAGKNYFNNTPCHRLTT